MLKRIWVDMIGAKGANIYWEIGAGQAPVSIVVQWSRNANGDTWEDVGTAAGDSWTLSDVVQRIHGQRNDVWYRVTVTYADGTTETSPAVNGYGGMPKRDWLIAQKIITDKYLEIVKGDGHRGLLYKRKRWGDQCSCVDVDSTMAAEPSCPLCYGTGIKDGYYPGVPLWGNVAEYAKKLNFNGPGIDERVTIQGVFVALPEPEPRDLWVDTSTGRRYIIGVDDAAFQVSSSIRGRPLIITAQLTPIEASDITMTLTSPIENSEIGPYRPLDVEPALPSSKVNPYDAY